MGSSNEAETRALLATRKSRRGERRSFYIVSSYQKVVMQTRVSTTGVTRRSQAIKGAPSRCRHVAQNVRT
jgi:hypothetical protein